MPKKYQSEQLMVCHQDAEVMRRLGILSDTEMREFDDDCLVPDPKAPKKAHASVPPAYASPRKA
jgi:hypothetical protein